MNYRIHTIVLVLFLCIGKLFGQKMVFNSGDGVKIAYSDEGKGKAVFLIHGFISSGDSWKKQP